MIKCILENGVSVQLRHVTVDAIVVKEGQILLIKRAGNSLEEPNKYALPGGYLDKDENPSEAVKRELKEETGYESGEARLFRLIANPNRKGSDRQAVDLVFTVNSEEKTSEPDQEVTDIKWFDLADLPGEEEFAFDHYETIQLYIKYSKQKFSLPVLDI